MKELVILIGPPGSGKTTYCKNHLKDYRRISQDDMGRHESMKVFKDAIKFGAEKIVIDRMNFDMAQRMRFVLPATRAGYSIKYLMFDVLDDNFNKLFKRIVERDQHPTINLGDYRTAAGDN